MRVYSKRSFTRVARYAFCIAPLFFAIPSQAQNVSSVLWMSSECTAPPTTATGDASVLASVFGVILGPLIQSGIKGLGDAIAKAGASSEIHGVGTLETYLYAVIVPKELNKLGQPELRFSRRCLIAAFAPKTKPDARPLELAAKLQNQDSRPLTETGAWNPDLTAQLGAELDSTRMSVLVASLDLSRDGTAFRFVPQFASLGEAFDGKTRERSLTFTTSLLPPGSAADGTAAAVRSITFDKVVVARVVGRDEARLSETSWMPVPSIPETLKARIDSTKQRLADAYGLYYSLSSGVLKADEKKKADADLDRLKRLLDNDRNALKEIAPYTVRVDAHQTRPGSPFLVNLGTFLSGNSDKIATPIADAVNTEKRAAAAETGAQKVEALRITAITEAESWAKAVAAKDGAAARIARIKLGSACRQIEAEGFSEPACVFTP